MAVVAVRRVEGAADEAVVVLAGVEVVEEVNERHGLGDVTGQLRGEGGKPHLDPCLRRRLHEWADESRARRRQVEARPQALPGRPVEALPGGVFGQNGSGQAWANVSEEGQARAGRIRPYLSERVAFDERLRRWLELRRHLLVSESAGQLSISITDLLTHRLLLVRPTARSLRS